LAADFCR